MGEEVAATPAVVGTGVARAQQNPAPGFEDAIAQQDGGAGDQLRRGGAQVEVARQRQLAEQADLLQVAFIDAVADGMEAEARMAVASHARRGIVGLFDWHGISSSCGAW
jgi:hypothetical protein